MSDDKFDKLEQKIDNISKSSNRLLLSVIGLMVATFISIGYVQAEVKNNRDNLSSFINEQKEINKSLSKKIDETQRDWQDIAFWAAKKYGYTPKKLQN